jgi:hypothetical protein
METQFWPKVFKEQLKHVWEDHIKINLGEIGYMIVGWINFAQLGNSGDSRNLVISGLMV